MAVTTPSSSAGSWMKSRAIPPDPSTRPANKQCPVCMQTWEPLWNVWKGEWFFPDEQDGCGQCSRLEAGQIILKERIEHVTNKYFGEDGAYRDMTMEGYYPDPRYPSQAAAKKYVEGIIKAWAGGQWSKGFLLYSKSIGIGKTHLAIAAARWYVLHVTPKRWDQPLLAIWNMPSYIKALKNSYDDKINGGTSALQKSAREPALLVIDDAGAEYALAGDWLADIYYDIMDARWLARAPVIVTTNLDIVPLTKKLGDRAMSRMISITGKPVKLDGEDYRLKGV